MTRLTPRLIKALMRVGSINACEAERAFRGLQPRAEPPGMTEAYRELAEAERAAKRSERRMIRRMAKPKKQSGEATAKLAGRVLRGYEPTRNEIEALAASVLAQREEGLRAVKDIASQLANAIIEDDRIKRRLVQSRALGEQQSKRRKWSEAARLRAAKR